MRQRGRDNAITSLQRARVPGGSAPPARAHKMGEVEATHARTVYCASLFMYCCRTVATPTGCTCFLRRFAS